MRAGPRVSSALCGARSAAGGAAVGGPAAEQPRPACPPRRGTERGSAGASAEGGSTGRFPAAKREGTWVFFPL